jgi:hypothetical protein
MKASAFLALSCVLLCGCKTSNTVEIDVVPGPSAHPAITWRAIDLSPVEKKAVMDAVAARLKDPLSAQFGSITAAARAVGGDIRVCGKVNAKNGNGGYTGYSSFYAMVNSHRPQQATVISMARGHGEEAAILKFCENYGLTTY